MHTYVAIAIIPVYTSSLPTIDYRAKEDYFTHAPLQGECFFHAFPRSHLMELGSKQYKDKLCRTATGGCMSSEYALGMPL